jgi:cytidine deaminase
MRLNTRDKHLVEEAKQAVIRSRPVRLKHTGDVGAALVTSKGNVYSGVCIGFYCGIDSCAEYQAIGAMISAGEKEIKAIAAVWYNEKTKKYWVIPPCGKCREIIKQTCKKNMGTDVVIHDTKKVKLKALLPHAWGGTIDK